MGQALYRKWRPQTFDDIVGQAHVVRTLRQALQTGRIHHAYLLAGPRGTGKTTTARLIAKAVNCLADDDRERPCDDCEICHAVAEARLMDLIEIDAASNTGVDNIRELLEKVGFRPARARYKVYVVDEVHMLSTAAFNALLKTLEEPPEHVIFVLATTEVHRIPETILSRCQRFEFRRIPLQAIVERLERIAQAEEIAAEPEALALIGRTATGSMRDAISLFDQMAAGGEITADYVRLMLGAERREVIRALLQAWLDGDMQRGLAAINDAIDGGADPRQLARQTADFLRGLLLMRLGAGETWADPTAEERRFFAGLAQQADPQRLVEAVRLFSEVASKRRAGWQPQLPLELAFVQATLPPTPVVAVAQPQAAAVQPQAAATSKTPEQATASAPADAQPATKPAASSTSSRARPRRVRRVRSVSGEEPEQPAAHQEPANTPQQGVDPTRAETLKGRWRDVVKQIQPVSLGALLRDANVAGVDEQGRLVLAFQHSFHRERVSEQSQLSKLEQQLAPLVGGKVVVHCLMQGEWQPPTRTSASRPAARSAVPKPSVPEPPEPPPDEEDELIRRAEEELGAVARVDE